MAGGLAEQIHGQMIATIESGISAALDGPVKELVIGKFLEHAASDIYAAWSPKKYGRRNSFTQSGSYAAMRPSMTSLRVEPHVSGNPEGALGPVPGDLTAVIEGGGPYDYTPHPGARPFVANTQADVDGMAGAIAGMVTSAIQGSF